MDKTNQNKQRKQVLSVLSNIAYMFRKHWRIQKLTVFCFCMTVILQVALPFIGLLMPKLVIDQIENQANPMTFITVIGLTALLLIVITAVSRFTHLITHGAAACLSFYDELHQLAKKQMSMDYELLEHPEVDTMYEKAYQGMRNNYTEPNNIPQYVVGTLTNLFGLILYAGVITMIHPMIILLLAVSAIINWVFQSTARKYFLKNRESLSKSTGKIEHMQNTLLQPDGAKDIRMYGMLDWLMGTKNRFINDARNIKNEINNRNIRAALVESFLVLIRDGFAYAYLIYMLLADRITLSNFVFVFGVIGGFAVWTTGLVSQARKLLQASLEMDDVRAFYAIKDKSNKGHGAAVCLDKMPGIYLSDVSYVYPNNESPTLEQININIKPGERIAIVGSNGAGKTTLIKLICGLYQVKTGKVEIDGVCSADFNRDEYFTMFSVVFQDIHMLAESIAQNISQAPEEFTDYTRVNACLRRAGLYEKVQELPQKEHTMMVKSIHQDAIALSGGEMQKLALARALYKDAPIIILDEPTAALDPIAESEIYNQYAMLTHGKTSIYISHRLASTRFCDRILFIDDHRIVEEGSHDDLMAQKGKYAEMFQIQSQYYRNESEMHV